MQAADLKILMQLLRITNQLYVWQRLQVLINKDHNQLFDFRNKTELLFQLISSLKEASKIFFRDIYPTLNKEYIPKDLIDICSKYAKRLENRDNDDYFRVVEYIRNNIMFHYSSNIYNGIIKATGQTEIDILIGVVVGNTMDDLLYTEPYTAMFMQIAELIPEGVDKNNFYDWLFEHTIAEAAEIIKIVNGIAKMLIKGKYDIREMDDSEWKQSENARN